MDERLESMYIVTEFLDRYGKEIDYYDQVARIVARRLEAALSGAGLRAIVTSRSKDLSRLQDKLKQRNARNPYTSVAGVYADIADLAGVRVALYFPGERDQVGKLITRLFDEYDSKREFPLDVNHSENRKFSGYSAVHYRVRLRSGDLEESEQRYSDANVEIQVASVLMHAWSEVEHDLVYKPEGAISPQEHSLLDQLNGLVLAGEISLEQLQKAGEARVAQEGRAFQNHYDLAAHLLSKASSLNLDEIDDSGMGRVDVLYSLLSELGKNTPEDLKPYLREIHGHLEKRPLAEQIIDAVLIEDQSLYEKYQRIRERIVGKPTAAGDSGEVHREIGAFLSAWVELERLLREVTLKEERVGAGLFDPKWFRNKGDSGRKTLFELMELRKFRNRLVHGIDAPSEEQLHASTEGVRAIIDELEKPENSV
ncbi:GTP pyrophosphokinase [Arthrobacter ramosus]|uniref:GTP pyrophosphokinase family protein n=1 Tax=Arthrobacter ramosus TaxID=1672 RepID=A0ABV5XWY2_ARTRM|nr:RelA/SpoT domain-containing protein [Arthrobacter ramosus]